MNEYTADRYVREADRSLAETYEEPIDLKTYVERVFENPRIVSHAARYVLDAIESAGTRTVFENGEYKERYRFFDDPHNDGEHAVLGNTDMLNAFVDDLRSNAAGRGQEKNIIWFAGPTASGKSELKRCLINGIREFSKTESGRRYTIEWNVNRTEPRRGLSYGDVQSAEARWYESPIQAHPMSVFPPEVRTQILTDLASATGEERSVAVDKRLDPFSQVAYDALEAEYRRNGKGDLFSTVTAGEHLRVTNYVVDVGQGIGVLHAEDSGTPKERLVGGWIPELLRDLDSRGWKNPQAFSYDGVLSQGNNGLTIVEDASQHGDLIQKLLSVPEEGRVKLDTGIVMDVDTLLVLISNPDLEAQLNRHEDRRNRDPLKALKRRLDRREFTYLTNLGLEVQLLRRELTEEQSVWEFEEYEEIAATIREPVHVTVREDGGPSTNREFGSSTTREFAPHAIEAAAMYDVVSRLDADRLPSFLDRIDKMLLYDRGYVTVDDERIEASDVDVSSTSDGDHGIPVTYTLEVLASLIANPPDRSKGDLSLAGVIMPGDVIEHIEAGLIEAPVISQSERDEYAPLAEEVDAYVFEQQEADVLEAMLRAHELDEETVESYVEHVYGWATGEPIETDRGEAVSADPLTMKVFEIEEIGRFDEDDYDGTAPTEAVESFRRTRIITALNRQAWEQRGSDFRVDDVDLAEIPVIDDMLDANDWDDVRRIFGDFEPTQWADPPTGTETERVKEETIENLKDRGYSRASAELTSRRVVEGVSRRWD
ncbi:MAG: kinase anchor protein [Halodesulfurarchaeum sp.]